jgi:hypothetical protein
MSLRRAAIIGALVTLAINMLPPRLPSVAGFLSSQDALQTGFSK